ncbi:MAG: TlpA family protein disulfide reductase [Fimbriimonadaceae bacterium]|jgi:thiol-disulfide isomerase/thioredoxin|nr:TlpA family protein disulfide reductase [Fimbriimonadaceae bacterium]
MVSSALALLITTAASLQAAPAASSIAPGSPAPAIDVKYWVKGKEVKDFATKGVYVVEFWATWCPPCIDAIPHLTSLAKKNTDVTFIGVSIWEDNAGKQVEKFVERMGNKMDYNVAYGGEKEKMALSWMDASGSRGIPTTFVVKDRVIQWIGHPMELDEPLAKIKAGTWDVKKAQKEWTDGRAREELIQQINQIGEQAIAGDRVKAKSDLNELEKKIAPGDKEAKQEVAKIKLMWLALEDFPTYEKQVKTLAEDESWSQSLGVLPIMLTAEKAGYATAEKAATLLISLKEDLWYLYVGVEVFTRTENAEKRKETAKKAMALMEKKREQGDEDLFEHFKKASED